MIIYIRHQPQHIDNTLDTTALNNVQTLFVYAKKYAVFWQET